MGKTTDHRARFGRNFRLLALGTAASRIAGFARELATSLSFLVGTLLLWCGLVHCLPIPGHRRCVVGCFKILFAAIVTGAMVTLLRDWSMGWDLPTWHLIAVAELIRLTALAPCGLLLYLATVRILGVEG